MGQHLVSFGTWFLFFVMIERMGELAVGVSGIVRSAYMLILVPVWSLGSVANALTSQLIGRNETEQVWPLLRHITRISYCIIIPLVLVCVLFPQQIAMIYTEETHLALSSVPAMYVICVGALAQCFAIILFEAVSGTGNTLMAFLLELGVLVFYILYIVLTSNVLAMPIAVVWGAEIVYAVLLGIVCFIYLKRSSWQNRQV